MQIFGVGGCGIEIVSKSKGNNVLIDTDIAHLSKFKDKKNNFSILCSKDGRGCNGNNKKGYISAKDILSNLMFSFDSNEFNVFVLGLGRGAGIGITTFILEKLRKNRQNNKKNIVICVYPHKVEKTFKKAEIDLKRLKQLADKVYLFKNQGELKEGESLWKITGKTDKQILGLINKL